MSHHPTIREILHTADGIKDKPMLTPEESLQESFESLSVTVLRVKAERDALLEACRSAIKHIGNAAPGKAARLLKEAIAKAEGQP